MQFTREALDRFIEVLNKADLRSQIDKRRRLHFSYYAYAGEQHRAEFGFGIPVRMVIDEVTEEA